MISQKICNDISEWFLCFFSPLHLAGIQILRPVLTPYLRFNKYPFFDFSITYAGKFIFQILKCSAISIHCFDEIFMNPSFMCIGDK
jgi:hypothetical protein